MSTERGRNTSTPDGEDRMPGVMLIHHFVAPSCGVTGRINSKSLLFRMLHTTYALEIESPFNAWGIVGRCPRAVERQNEPMHRTTCITIIAEENLLADSCKCHSTHCHKPLVRKIAACAAQYMTCPAPHVEWHIRFCFDV